jgi:hypothetical protein
MSLVSVSVFLTVALNTAQLVFFVTGTLAFIKYFRKK